MDAGAGAKRLELIGNMGCALPGDAGVLALLAALAEFAVASVDQLYSAEPQERGPVRQA